MTSSETENNVYYRTISFSCIQSVFVVAQYVHAGMQTNKALPLRWMAPEMLAHKRATVQTDVYSYGIVMLEIFTLGKLPFDEMSNEQLIQHLLRHHKMGTRSCLCGVYGAHEVFVSRMVAVDRVMSTCTSASVGARPSFGEIAQSLHPVQWLRIMNEFLSTPFELDTDETSL